ncbi:MAG: DsbC family protein [Burkholderiales bacterium]|nr:DsbC family protein [Burkholderiales bacterium]
MIKKILFSSLFAFCVNANAITPDALKDKLHQMYPKTAISSVSSAEFDGLFAVSIGNTVAYTDESGRYFLFGHLFDMQSQVDLTEERRPHETPKAYFPKDNLLQAVKEVKGDGSRKIAIFTDPDCPYCKQLEAHLINVTNVTIYRFFYPLEGLHPAAKARAISIWCSENPQQTWTDWMLSGKQPPLKTCLNPVAQNVGLGSKLQIMGTPTIIAENGALLPGSSTTEEIEAFLAKEKSK